MPMKLLKMINGKHAQLQVRVNWKKPLLWREQASNLTIRYTGGRGTPSLFPIADHLLLVMAGRGGVALSIILLLALVQLHACSSRAFIPPSAGAKAVHNDERLNEVVEEIKFSRCNTRTGPQWTPPWEPRVEGCPNSLARPQMTWITEAVPRESTSTTSTTKLHDRSWLHADYVIARVLLFWWRWWLSVHRMLCICARLWK